MPSTALETWNTIRAAALDEIEGAHRSVGGTGPGRRYATQQINQAYAVLLSAQFQGFCRDLHTESADLLVGAVPSADLQMVLRVEFGFNRALDRGNPNSGNIGSDFNRLGLTFWDAVDGIDPLNPQRRKALDQLNVWRNAIAHQDFDPARLGGHRDAPASGREDLAAGLSEARSFVRRRDARSHADNDRGDALVRRKSMSEERRTNKTKPSVPRFKVGDRVLVRLPANLVEGVIVEDRGLLGAGKRRLYRVGVRFDEWNTMYMEIPEEELAPVEK